MCIQLPKGNFTLTTDKNRMDRNAVYRMLAKSYWASNRPKEKIDNSIENSLCFCLFDGDVQIGFARVITDFSVFAYLCDVYIEEDYRGKGLGKWMIECMLEYTPLKEIKRWALHTQDAHGLYRQYGFGEPKRPESIMERLREV